MYITIHYVHFLFIRVYGYCVIRKNKSLAEVSKKKKIKTQHNTMINYEILHRKHPRQLCRVIVKEKPL